MADKKKKLTAQLFRDQLASVGKKLFDERMQSYYIAKTDNIRSSYALKEYNKREASVSELKRLRRERSKERLNKKRIKTSVDEDVEEAIINREEETDDKFLSDANQYQSKRDANWAKIAEQEEKDFQEYVSRENSKHLGNHYGDVTGRTFNPIGALAAHMDYSINQLISRFADGATSANASGKIGEISRNDLELKKIDAFLTVNEIQDRIKNLTEQRDQLLDAYAPTAEGKSITPSPEIMAQIDMLGSLITDALLLLDALDSDTKELSDQYKVDKIDRSGIDYGYVSGFFSDAWGSVKDFSFTPGQTEKNRTLRHQKEREQKILEFDLKNNKISRLAAGKEKKDLLALKQSVQKDLDDTRALQDKLLNMNLVPTKSTRMWLEQSPDEDLATQFGSSNSSESQIKANAAQLVGEIAAIPFGPQALAFVGKGVELLTMPWQLKATLDENYAEWADSRKQYINDRLGDNQIESEHVDSIMPELLRRSVNRAIKQGRSVKWIKDHYGVSQINKNGIVSDPNEKQKLRDAVMDDIMSGYIRTVDPVICSMLLESLKGREAQFLANNFRTGLGTAYQMATFAGIGKILDKANRGARIGSDAGEMLGFGGVGQAAGGAIGGMADKFMSDNQRQFLKGVESWFDNKYNNLYYGILGDSKVARSMFKYGYDQAKDALKEAASNRAEEGVQYLNGNYDFASLYGFGHGSLFDTAAHDFNMGYLVFKTDLAYLGLGDSELLADKEYWQNVNAGGLMGGFNPGVTQTVHVARASADMYRQYDTFNAIKRASVMDREAAKQSRTAGVEFARQAIKGKTQHVLDAINDLQELDRRKDDNERTFSDDDYESLKQDAASISRIANDEAIERQLKKHGIEKGTDRYAYAVSEIYSNIKQRKDINDEISSVSKSINEAVNSKEFNDAVEEVVNYYQLISQFDAGTEALQRKYAQAAADKAEKDMRDRDREAGVNKDYLLSQEYKDKVQEVRNEAYDAAFNQFENNLIPNLTQLTKNKTLLTKKLKSLTLILIELDQTDGQVLAIKNETGVSIYRPDAKLIRKSIERQISDTKQQLIKYMNLDTKSNDEQRSEKSNEQLVLDLENKEEIAQFDSSNLEKQFRAQALLVAAQEVNSLHSRMYASDEANENSNFSKKIDMIMNADVNNLALDAMANDIAIGNGIERLMEEDYEQQLQDIKDKAEKIIEELKKRVQEQKDASVNSPKQNEHKQESPKRSFKENAEAVVAALDATVRSKFKKRAKEFRGKMHKEWELADARRARGVRNLGMNDLSDNPVFNKLVSKNIDRMFMYAQAAIYTIGDFVSDVRDAAKRKGVESEIDEGKLKLAYMRAKDAVVDEHEELEGNFSTDQEILSYGVDTDKKREHKDKEAKSTPASKLQSNINQDREKIDIENYWDVITKDGIVYTNESESAKGQEFSAGLRDVDRFNKMVDALKKAKDSQEEWEKILDYYSDMFVEGYYDVFKNLRNTDGIEGVIARDFSTRMDGMSPTLVHAIAVRQAVAEIMSGQEVTDQNLAKNKEFVDKITSIRDKYLKMGCELVTSNSNIYGAVSGKNVSSQIDLVFIDGDGNAHIVDVFYTSEKFQDYYNSSLKSGATITLKQREQNLLNQIESILESKYGITTVEKTVLPVEAGDKALDEINPFAVEDPAEAAYDAQQFVSDYNEYVDEYNDIVKTMSILNKAGKTSEKPQKIDHASIIENGTKDQYLTQSAQLEQSIQNIKQEIDRLNDIISKFIDDSTLIIKDGQLILNETQDDEQNTVPAIKYLQDKTKSLDALVQILPQKAEDPQYQQQLAIALYEAQDALNQVLTQPDLRMENVIQEERAIAAAIEKIKGARFKNSERQVKYWWLTSFSLESTDNLNRNVANQATAIMQYRNAIKSWIGTLAKHVLNDELRDPRDIKFYSTLLNIHFAKLLDNAEKALNDATKNDPVQRAAFDVTTDYIDEYLQDFELLRLEQLALNNGNIIDAGRMLIEEFNDQWGVEPDESYDVPAQTEVEKINRMPVSWLDLYGRSENHEPASLGHFEGYWPNGQEKYTGGMDKDNTYYKLSQHPDFGQEGRMWTELKIAKSGPFAGQVVLNVGIHGEPRYATLAFTSDQSDYKYVSDDDKKHYRHVSRSNKKFIDKLTQAVKYAQQHSEYEVSYQVTVNKGRILYTQDRAPVPFNSFLFKGPENALDMYSISVSQKCRIGVLKPSVIVDGSSKYVSMDIVGGNDLTEQVGKFDDTYAKNKTQIHRGSLVFMYNTGKNRAGLPVYVGTAFMKRPIGQENASKIVKLIQSYVNGARVTQDGYNILDLLKMLLYMYDPTMRITPYNEASNLINIEDGQVTLGGSPVDIYSDSFLQQIANMLPSSDVALLNENLSTSSNSVFAKARELSKTQSRIELPNGIVLTKDDFTDPNGVPRQQSTWLGHLMRTGGLYTCANRVGSRHISIGNPKLVQKVDMSKPQIVDQQESSLFLGDSPYFVQEQPKTGQDLINDLFGFHAEGTTADMVDRNEAQASEFTDSVNAYFDKVIGNHDLVEVGKLMLTPNTGGNVVLGICSDSMVAIHSNAPESVMFHEAFHKVMELMMTTKEREKFYNLYKEAFNGVTNERDVAEGLADLFTDYMKHKKSVMYTKGFGKLRAIFKKLAFNIGLAWKLGPLRYIRFHHMWGKVNSGFYANRPVSKEAEDRFKKLFGQGLHYEVKDDRTGNMVNFLTLNNSTEVKRAAQALGTILVQQHGLSDALARDKKLSISEYAFLELDEKMPGLLDRLRSMHPMYAEVFEPAKRPKMQRNKETGKDEKVLDENGEPIMETYFPKYNVILKYIADYVASITNDYKGKFKKFDEDSDEDYEVQATNIERYDMKSYEVSALDSADQFAKQFFSTMVCMIKDENGQFVPDPNRAMYGIPTFENANKVFSILSRQYAHCNNLTELLDALNRDLDTSAIHKQAYIKLRDIMHGRTLDPRAADKPAGRPAYSTEIYKDADGTIHHRQVVNYDAESSAIQVLKAIRQQQMDFTITKVETTANGKEARNIRSSTERDMRSYPKQWSSFLFSGQIPIFQKNKDKDGNLQLTEDGGRIFTQSLALLNSVRAAMAKPDQKVKIGNRWFDKQNPKDISILKNSFIYSLNRLGIMFTRDDLDYMMTMTCRGNDAEQFAQFVNYNKSGIATMNSLTEDLSKIVKPVIKDGSVVGYTIDQKAAKVGYQDNGMVKTLGNYHGEYKRLSAQLTALGLNGKKYYMVSQNNAISHNAQRLSTGNTEDYIVKALTNDSYCLMNDNGVYSGSIVLKHIMSGDPLKLEIKTPLGTLTDHSNDNGTEYSELATIDDFIQKMSMLQDGNMIFPTLADKGTWSYISGVEIPGMKMLTIVGKNGARQVVVDPTTVPVLKYDSANNRWWLRPSDAVLDQMIEYAKGERQSIIRCMQQLGIEIPGVQSDPSMVLDKGAYIKNYHSKRTGTRFVSLTELWEPGYIDEQGHKHPTKPVNLNDPNVDAVKMLQRANEIFFEKRAGETDEEFRERQRNTMAYTMSIQTDIAMERARDMGLIDTKDILYEVDGKKYGVTKDQYTLMNATSEQLNQAQIIAVADAIFAQQGQSQWAKTPYGAQRTAYYEMCKAAAIAAILTDINYRSVISTEECMRCFIGNPAEFKVDYDKENGRIKDAAYDIQKRIGGLESTGDDNVTELPGFEGIYHCAEIDDYEVASSAEIYPRLNTMFTESAVREAYADGYVTKMIEKINPEHIDRVHSDDENQFTIEKAVYEIDDSAPEKKALFERLQEYRDVVGVKGKRQEANQLRSYLFDELRAYYAQKAWHDAYSLSIDELRRNAESINGLTERLDKAYSDGETYAAAYDDGINVADGAAYITSQTCKNMLRMIGKFTNEVAEAFEYLENPNTEHTWRQDAEAYAKVYEAVNIVPTKYTAYGFRQHTLSNDPNVDPQLVSDMAVSYYNKFALFPLLPGLATGRMHDVYEKMKNENVDMLFMNSAVKVGSQGSIGYDSDGHKNGTNPDLGHMLSTPFNKYDQHFQFLRKQLNTDPEEGDRIKIGTQMVKIACASLRLFRDNYVDMNGNTVSGQQIRDNLMRCINNIAELGRQQLDETFKTDGKLDPQKLSDYLKRNLNDRNANRGIIEAIETVTNPETGETELVAPLAATSDASWIEAILISTVNQNIIDINLPGSSFVQRSVFAIEDDNAGSITSADHYNGQKLEMVNEEGSMDALISIDYFENIIPKDLKTFAARRQWLIDNNIIGKTEYKKDENGEYILDEEGNKIIEREGAKANTIGYRIPTQAQSSIHPLRFIDVIEATKATVILPTEFTKTTGSDFDIDHLYLVSYNYKDGKIQRERGDGGIKDDINIQQNLMLDNFMTILKDTEYAMNSLYKSIDNDTALPKSIADQIPDQGSTKHHVYNMDCLHEQIIRKNDYITGKIGIGPFALNVTNQVLSYMYDITFSDTQFTRSTPIKGLNNLVDSKGLSIMSWLSGFINAHVDIVKDPWISKLNVNQFTYNMINLLTRCGKGEEGLWFIAQPVIRDMAQAADKAKSEYAGDQSESKFKRSLRLTKEALDKYTIDYSEDHIARLGGSNNKDDIQYRINIVNRMFSPKFQEAMKDIARNPGMDMSKEYVVEALDGKHQETLTAAQVLQQVYYAWKSLEKYSLALSRFVQYTKIDTKKHGKSMLEMIRYWNEYIKLMHPKNGQSIFNLEKLHAFDSGTWMLTKTQNAIFYPMEILSNQVYDANINFIETVYDMASELKQDEDQAVSVELMKKVSSHLQTAIKSKFFVALAKLHYGYTDLDITNLFIGQNSIAHRLNELIYKAKFDKEFEKFAGNPLFSSLYSLEERGDILNGSQRVPTPSFIAVTDNIDDSKTDADLLTDGWEELLKSDNEEMRKFAQDLVLYAFFSSGESKGWNKMFKFVPMSFLNGKIDSNINIEADGIQCTSYVDFVKQTLTDEYLSTMLEDKKADIFRNCTSDRQIVPRVPVKVQVDGKTVNNFTSSSDGTVLIQRAKTKEELTNLHGYILVKKPGMKGNNPDNFTMYQLIGVHKGKHPVYVQTHKSGYDNKGNIFEYGWLLDYKPNMPQGYASKAAVDEAIRKLESTLDLINSSTKQQSNDVAAITLYLSKVFNRPDQVQISDRGVSVNTQGQGYDMVKMQQIHDIYNQLKNDKVVVDDSNKNAIEKFIYNVYNSNAERYIVIRQEMNDGQVVSQKVIDLGPTQRAILDWLINSKRNTEVHVAHNPERSTVAIPKGTQLSTKPYYKGQPLKYPLIDFVFTENAQAAIANGFIGKEQDEELYQMYGFGLPKQSVKLNVTSNYGNQAGIRTDEQGNKTHNAYGIIVKKYQQDETGKFVSSEGQWNDTDAEFEQFKWLNNQVFGHIKLSPNETKVFPTLFALGKAALPKRFAQWLQSELYANFGIESVVKQNERADYDGYGLKVIDAVPKEEFETLMELGGDENALKEIDDVKKTWFEGITSQQLRNTIEPFFTEEEIAQIKQAVPGMRNGQLRVTSVSRNTDPIWFSKMIVKMLEENAKKPLTDPTRINAIELWSKHDGQPMQDILDACKKYRVAPMVSFSITGLGDTSLEKGVMKYEDLLDRIQILIENGDIDPKSTTIRVDPILPGVTLESDMRSIIERARGMGLHKFVTSVVQSYGYMDGTARDRHVTKGINEAMAKDGKTYDWDMYYGREKDGKTIKFLPKKEYIDQWGDFFSGIMQQYPDITIESCSVGIKGLKPAACLDPLILERLTGQDATREDGSYDRDTSRPFCMCYGAHQDMFRRDEKKCFSSCAYCYAGRGLDNAIDYYHEDGTMKETPYSTVRSKGSVLSAEQIKKGEEFRKNCKGK